MRVSGFVGDAVSKLETFVSVDFEPCFNAYNMVSVHPKSIIHDQLATLNEIFCAVVSVNRLAKI